MSIHILIIFLSRVHIEKEKKSSKKIKKKKKEKKKTAVF